MSNRNKKTPQGRNEKNQGAGLFSKTWYNTLHYQVVPPLFVVLFTAAVQWLGLLGAPPCPVDLSQCARLTGNSFSWMLVRLLFLLVHFVRKNLTTYHLPLM